MVFSSITAISGYKFLGLSFGPIAITSAILNCKGFKYSDVMKAFLSPPFPAKAIPKSLPQT